MALMLELALQLGHFLRFSFFDFLLDVRRTPPEEITERPRAPSGVAAFMAAHSKTPYITPSMDFSSGKRALRGRRGRRGQQLGFTLPVGGGSGVPVVTDSRIQGIVMTVALWGLVGLVAGPDWHASNVRVAGVCTATTFPIIKRWFLIIIAYNIGNVVKTDKSARINGGTPLRRALSHRNHASNVRVAGV